MNKKIKSPKSKSPTKKIWLIIAVAVIVVAAIITTIIIINNQPTKLASAYNKCIEKFNNIEEDDEVIVYLKPGTSEDTLKSMSAIMQTSQNVESVEVSTSEDEYQKMLDSYKDNPEIYELTKQLKETMISKLEAAMRIKVKDTSNLSGVTAIINNYKEFKENLSEDKAPIYPEIINFGTLELLDNGKTIMAEIGEDNYAGKIGCVASELQMPDRIKDAVGHTVAIDGTRQDEWGDLKMEWSYRDKKLHIVIYQK